MSPQIKLGSKKYTLPKSRILRIFIGVALVIGGILGFLPVLGFWMIPLGLIVLSVDIPIIRRWRRNIVLSWNRKKREARKVQRKENNNGTET